MAKKTFVTLAAMYKDDVVKDKILLIAKLCCNDQHLTEQVLDIYKDHSEEFYMSAIHGNILSTMLMWHLIVKGPVFNDEGMKQTFDSISRTDKLICSRVCYLLLFNMPELYYFDRLLDRGKVMNLAETCLDSIVEIHEPYKLSYKSQVKAIITDFVSQVLDNVQYERYCYIHTDPTDYSETMEKLRATKKLANDLFETVTTGIVPVGDNPMVKYVLATNFFRSVGTTPDPDTDTSTDTNTDKGTDIDKGTKTDKDMGTDKETDKDTNTDKDTDTNKGTDNASDAV